MKYKLLALFLLSFVLIFSFISCDGGSPTENSEQSTPEPEISITGKWNWVVNSKNYFMELDPSGDGILHYYQGAPLPGYVNIKINSWGFNKNTMRFTIAVPGQIAGHYTVTKLTSTELKLDKIPGNHYIGFGLTDSDLTR